MSKASVLCSYLDGGSGMPTYLLDIIQKHFHIVWLEDFEKDSSKCSNNILAILNVHGQPKVTQSLLERLPNLKLVAVVGVGYNHIDTKLLHSFNVKLSNTPFVLDDATADLGMTLLMAAGRNLCAVKDFAMAPDTTELQFNEVSCDVSSTTLGIVGMGRVGYKVAQRAKGFEMKILYHNRNQRPSVDEKAINATYYKTLNEMLPLCDYVMVTVCLTPETTNIMGAEQFKLMKSTAILVNISRGATVDQDALLKALNGGDIGFAALDVTSPEPLPRDHPLLKARNILITPHVGSATLTTRRKMMQKAMNNVLAAAEGKPLPSEVKL
ncbi:unnamed protein product [Clavelina lepadiformis]|uniref:2-ketogluconate reductase n=1 Tax=Clavelina lepadiformis TaxID=159417 RepID=A0ABP0FF80_CLALP